MVLPLSVRNTPPIDIHVFMTMTKYAAKGEFLITGHCYGGVG